MSARRFSAFVFRAAMRLYPSSVRRDFGSEMWTVLEQRLGDGSQPAARVWMRELLALPFNVTEAWLGAAGARAPFGSGVFWPAAAVLLLTAGATGSHLIAAFGLAHPAALALFLLVLIPAGMSLGLSRRARSRRVQATGAGLAVLLFAAGAGGSVGMDRLLTVRLGDASMRLPGVRVDAAMRNDESQLEDFAPLLETIATPRRRVDVSVTDEQALIRVVRGGGADGLYALFTIMLLSTGMHLTLRPRRVA